MTHLPWPAAIYDGTRQGPRGQASSRMSKPLWVFDVGTWVAR